MKSIGKIIVILVRNTEGILSNLLFYSLLKGSKVRFTHSLEGLNQLYLPEE